VALGTLRSLSFPLELGPQLQLSSTFV
jgi:hypothetical protein